MNIGKRMGIRRIDVKGGEEEDCKGRKEE